MYGNNYQLPVYPAYNFAAPIYPQYPEPPPSFGGDDAMPLPFLGAAINPYGQPYPAPALDRRYQNNGQPLDQRNIIIVNNQAGPARAIHHAAQPRFTLFDRLWNGVKAVLKFAVRLTVGAFKLLWEVVKVVLKIIAYTALGLFAAAVILNPTPASVVALAALALLIAANNRRCCC